MFSANHGPCAKRDAELLWFLTHVPRAYCLARAMISQHHVSCPASPPRAICLRGTLPQPQLAQPGYDVVSISGVLHADAKKERAEVMRERAEAEKEPKVRKERDDAKTLEAAAPGPSVAAQPVLKTEPAA